MPWLAWKQILLLQKREGEFLSLSRSLPPSHSDELRELFFRILSLQLTPDVLHGVKKFKRRLAALEQLVNGLHNAVMETLQETAELKQL